MTLFQTLNSVPLLRLYRPRTSNHFYTTSIQESQNAVTNLNYIKEYSPGNVSLTATDCLCANTLTPIFRLYRHAPEDHLYTASEEEAIKASTKLGYNREGTKFYCATKQNQCGASKALYRYFRGTEHFYTTNLNEGENNVVKRGGTSEGILCYIW